MSRGMMGKKKTPAVLSTLRVAAGGNAEAGVTGCQPRRCCRGICDGHEGYGLGSLPRSAARSVGAAATPCAEPCSALASR